MITPFICRGRGARERIPSASQQLFRDHGIHCTGMDQLSAVSGVSKRTLYQHFDCTDLTPRERLLAVFDIHAPLCPFIVAAVESQDPDHPARVLASDYKKAFAARLTEAARASLRN